MECGPFVFRTIWSVPIILVLSTVMAPHLLAADVRVAQANAYDDRYRDDYDAPYETRDDQDLGGDSRDSQYDDRQDESRDDESLDEKYGEPIEGDFNPDARAETEIVDDDFDQRRSEQENEPQENQLFQNLTRFVQHDYFGNGQLNHVSEAALFAARVDYYGRRGLSRRAVDASRQSYYRKWPERRYELIPESMQITQRGEDSVDVVFKYNFELAGRRKRIRGIGRTRLTVRHRDEDGTFEITRENGRVLRRH